MDETDFVINMNDGKTLEVNGASSVKYHDVVWGGAGMTLVLTLICGSRASLEVPMLTFKNSNCSYPIAGLLDTVPGAAYRIGPRGWMDRRVFGEWLREDRCLRRDPHDRHQVMSINNAGGHKPVGEAEAALEKKRIDIHFLPPNSIDLCQLADANVIQ